MIVLDVQVVVLLSLLSVFADVCKQIVVDWHAAVLDLVVEDVLNIVLGHFFQSSYKKFDF